MSGELARALEAAGRRLVRVVPEMGDVRAGGQHGATVFEGADPFLPSGAPVP